MRRDWLKPNWLGIAGVARLSLRVVGYQYPESVWAARGSDWLVIEGTVEDGDDRWEFCDPCLKVEELESLIAWFEDASTNPASIEFTEPLLSFGRTPQLPDVIECRLRAEAVAAVLDPFDERWTVGRSLALEANRNACLRFIHGLRADLARFPRRQFRD